MVNASLEVLQQLLKMRFMFFITAFRNPSGLHASYISGEGLPNTSRLRQVDFLIRKMNNFEQFIFKTCGM